MMRFPVMDFHTDSLRRWFSAQRRERLDKPSAVAFCFVLFWFAGNVISPFLAPPGTIDFGEDGIVGAGDKSDEISEIENGFARFFYRAGDANCHQIASRSLFLNGNQMPFCSRCTAIFFGLVLGVLVMMFMNLELNIFWILLGLVPMAIDGGVQLITDYESTNLIRFITGSIAGAVTGIALGFIVSEMGKMAVHRRGFKKGP